MDALVRQDNPNLLVHYANKAINGVQDAKDVLMRRPLQFHPATRFQQMAPQGAFNMANGGAVPQSLPMSGLAEAGRANDDQNSLDINRAMQSALGGYNGVQ